MEGLKGLIRKSRGDAGETLAETLVGLLIASLALLMLAGAISATAKIINTSDIKLGEYYKMDGLLVAQEGTTDTDLLAQKSSGGTVNIVRNGTTPETLPTAISVKFYTNDAFNKAYVAAYKKQ